MRDADRFLAARDFLLAHRERYTEAYSNFRWPELERFNWALDYFDPMARGNDAVALSILRDDGSEERHTFQALAERSNRLANSLRASGARRGDRLLLMLPNVVQTWETILACMKLGVVVVPATPQLGRADLEDRFARGAVRHVVTDGDGAPKFEGLAGDYTKLVVGAAHAGWARYEDAYDAPADFAPDGETRADDPLLLYFTSGTTAKPKLVLHTHA